MDNISKKKLEEAVKKYKVVDKVLLFGIDGEHYRFNLLEARYDEDGETLVLTYKRCKDEQNKP